MSNKGKFINTTHSENIGRLVDSTKKIINNPYYLWANRQPTIVLYFNQNKEMSTVDEGFKGIYEDNGKDSSIFYNKIENFYIYGLEQLQIQMEHGEFGAESSEITGEGIILPNTIIPYVGDYFKITYIEEDYMFRIIDASPDTLENGANMYKITFKLESEKDHETDLNVKESFEMVTNNIGTGFNTVIHSTKADLIKRLEEFLHNLKRYYMETFYSERVQSFIYKFHEMRLYDPYMTQFLMDNGILKGDIEYIYITQHIHLNSKFAFQYERSFYRCVEKKDKKRLRRYENKAVVRYIDGIDTTIFASRPEDYCSVDMNYHENELYLFLQVPCFSDNLIDHIESGQLFNGDDSIYNIIVKYFNDKDLCDEDIDILDFDFHNNIKIFYTVPIIIYCIEAYIKHMMTGND